MFMEQTSGGGDRRSVFMNIHQATLLVNLRGDIRTFRNILEPGFFELDGKRLYALRRPEFDLRLSRIAIR